jgi:hypothetical protein
VRGDLRHFGLPKQIQIRSIPESPVALPASRLLDDPGRDKARKDIGSSHVRHAEFSLNPPDIDDPMSEEKVE